MSKLRVVPAVPAAFLLCCAVAVVVAACSPGGSDPETSDIAAGEPASAGEATGTSEADADFVRAFNGLIDEDEGFGDLRIDTMCLHEDRLVSGTLLGRGVGFWDSREQVAVPENQVRAVLADFVDAEFATMPDVFGREFETQGTPQKGQGRPRVVCQIVLSIPGYRKEVTQMARGTRSEVLMDLGTRILDTARLAEGERVVADSLQDGLTKIVDGVLVPQALRLVIHRPEIPGEAGPAPAFLVQLKGAEAELRDATPDGGITAATELFLSDDQIVDIARILADGGAGSLPANVWAGQYTDLHLDVMQFSHSIQGDRFEGREDVDPEAQQAFADIVSRLYDTHQRLSPTR